MFRPYRVNKSAPKIPSQGTRIFAACTVKVNSGGKAPEKKQLDGKDYLVVPVTALVEGPIQGILADSPELVTQQAMEHFPWGWNGRPVTLGHPKANGHFTSANIPSVLPDYYMGMLFNTQVTDGKLKVEAWIDIAACESKGDKFLEAYQALERGDEVEVSTGLWCDVVPAEGKFNGKAYTGIWANIVPDHLAILMETTGACSIADGCGANRVNASSSLSPAQPNNAAEGSNMSQATVLQMAPGATGIVTPPAPNMQSVPDPTQVKTQCAGGTSCTCNTTQPSTVNLQKVPLLADRERLLERFTVHAIADGITLGDVHTQMQMALKEKFGRPWVYILAMTKETVAYEYWDESSGYQVYGLDYNIAADGKVTFKGEAKKAKLLTKIITSDEVRANEAPTEDAPSTASETGSSTDTTQGDSEMSGANGTAAPVTNQSTPTPRPITLQSFLANASPADRALVESAIKTHNDRKAGFVSKVLASKRNKFNQQQLESMDVDTLGNMVELIADDSTPNPIQPNQATPAPVTNTGVPSQAEIDAALAVLNRVAPATNQSTPTEPAPTQQNQQVVDFSGRAGVQPRTNAQNDQNSVPVAPSVNEIFAPKAA